jgi:hypothetical protein
VEFVDEGGVIRLLIRRRVPVSDAVAGFGLATIQTTPKPRASVRRSSTLHRRGLEFADALHWASSASCSQFMSFDDCRFVRRARRLKLEPVVVLPK